MTREPESQPKNRLRWVLAVGAGVVALLLAGAAWKSYRDLGIVRSRRAELEERLRATEERTQGLRYRLELLRDDPAMLEGLARDELGMVGRDDLVFVVEPAPAADSLD